MQIASDTKINNATRVTTLWEKKTKNKKNNLVLSERNNYASLESLQAAVVAKPDQLNSLYKLGPYTYCTGTAT